MISLLANQGLLVAHAHPVGEGNAEGHSHRPHFHWGGHGHAHDHGDHGHVHSTQCNHSEIAEADGPMLVPPIEHDADAIYVTELVSTPTTSQANLAALLADSTALPIAYDVDQGEEGLLQLCLLPDIASRYGDARPIYLRTLSLRN